MPATKVIKPRPLEAQRKLPDRTKPVKVKAAEPELGVPAVRNSRASSCPKCPQRDRSARASTGTQGSASKTTCERRARSTSTAPKPENWLRTNPDHLRAVSSVKHPAGRGREQRSGRAEARCPGHREQRSGRAEARCPSYKAFTVIPPNPKKRREIQRKAEAELAALEEFRLSRAMAYVSINPSSVGGCMSLEEVRLKQQQEMMQAKRRPKPMRKQVMEEAPVLTS